MHFEWDERKNHANIEKHGIDFTLAKEIFNGPILERIDPREYGEVRYQALGMVGEQVLFVVYTLRGHARRLISARKAERHEQQTYYKKIFG